LIIDADMRSPSIHGFAGVDNRQGLSNFLTGDNDWRALVHADVAGGLDLMSAGPMPPSAAELLSSDRMTFLVKALGEHYDVVVTTNMFGDIVTDLASVLQGGMGMAVGCHVGDRHAMFEPIHGAAPKYAG
ncbi:MAG TPA: isocitrate/isopropylmalate family dehydrogenase, partial [Novosphingobium sp.]|nr:isocitrate/isopropylmalate family dehydrogenase [Novosphingobium sp.]